MIESEHHEFVNWYNAVPPYSATPHGGIPSDAFVHTVSIEVTYPCYPLSILTGTMLYHLTVPPHMGVSLQMPLYIQYPLR